MYVCMYCLYVNASIRDLCRIKLLPVTHVLVDTWMLTFKPVYTLSNVPDDLKKATSTNTHMAPFTFTFKAYLTISMFLEDLFLAFIFLPVPPYFYPSMFVFTCPNDGWTVLHKAMADEVCNTINS